jgi:hypothetical protein
MSANERSLPRKLSIKLPALSENALITIIAVGFLILHILAGVILLKAPAVTPHEEARPSLYD